jgi:hypothetical protein
MTEERKIQFLDSYFQWWESSEIAIVGVVNNQSVVEALCHHFYATVEYSANTDARSRN